MAKFLFLWGDHIYECSYIMYALHSTRLKFDVWIGGAVLSGRTRPVELTAELRQLIETSNFCRMYSLNWIRHGRNSTYELGLSLIANDSRDYFINFLQAETGKLWNNRTTNLVFQSHFPSRVPYATAKNTGLPFFDFEAITPSPDSVKQAYLCLPVCCLLWVKFERVSSNMGRSLPSS